MDMLKDVFKRREGLQGQRQALMDQIKQLDEELSDLDAAERVFKKKIQFGDGGKENPKPKSLKAPVTDFKPRPDHPFAGTIRDLALQILSDLYPRGLRSAAICKLAVIHYKREINKNSLTVTLGRLKEDGLVRNEGQTWYIIQR